jgi:hypothetical protein
MKIKIKLNAKFWVEVAGDFAVGVLLLMPGYVPTHTLSSRLVAP